MDHNVAAWMIAGGPHLETEMSRREREQLHAYLDSRRETDSGPGFVQRLRDLIRPVGATEPSCCPA